MFNLYISLMREFANITVLMNKLGVKASYALLSLHVITGCNTVDKFPKNIGLKDFFENYDIHAKLKNELVKFQVAERLTEEIEKLICKTYLRPEKEIDSLENIPATRLKGPKLTPTRGHWKLISSELSIIYEYG